MMYPVTLDVTRLPAALAGNEAAALRRLARLDAAGAARVTVFAESPDPRLTAAGRQPAHEQRHRAAVLVGAVRMLLKQGPAWRQRS